MHCQCAAGPLVPQWGPRRRRRLATQKSSSGTYLINSFARRAACGMLKEFISDGRYTRLRLYFITDAPKSIHVPLPVHIIIKSSVSQQLEMAVGPKDTGLPRYKILPVSFHVRISAESRGRRSLRLECQSTPLGFIVILD